MVDKNQSVIVQGIEIHISTRNEEDYISLTDMVQKFEGKEQLILNWLQNKNTLEFLAVWENLNNPNFNPMEFHRIKNEAGLNRFVMSAKKWVNLVNGIGLIAKAGRYGGTFAHKDIAFEFGSWLSPEFKLYLIKEFQRLKQQESHSNQLDWDVKRSLTKVNYRIHTDAIKTYLIPNEIDNQSSFIYATEADLLNVALFGCTAKQWRDANTALAKEKNIRDYATLNQLAVLSNLESHNAELIKHGIEKKERYKQLATIANYQLGVLSKADVLKAIPKSK